MPTRKRQSNTPHQPNPEAENTTELRKIERRINARIAALRRTYNAVAELEVGAPELSYHEIEAQTAYGTLQDLQDEALDICSDEDVPRIEALLEAASALRQSVIAEAIRIKRSVSSTSQERTTSEIRLPRINLPNFDGDVQKWKNFSDLFKVTVHENPSLSGTQKLQYLKSTLRGEAARLLNNLSITEVNYEAGWKILNDYYEDEREQIYTHIRKFVHRSPVTKGSEIRSFVIEGRECISALKALNQPVHAWDAVLNVLTIEKLDAETRQEWELSLKSKEVPKYAELEEFLHIRSRTFANNSQETGNERTTNQKSNNGFTCKMCKRNHLLRQCEKFIQLATQEKRRFVNRNNLCYNCLSPTHQTEKCIAGNCQKCGKKHHTLLHQNNTSTPAVHHTIEDKEATDHKQIHSSTIDDPIPAASVNFATNPKAERQSTILLPTAIVRVICDNGETKTLRAMVDQCAQANLITESAVRALGLKINPEENCIIGANATPGGNSSGTADFSIRSTQNDFQLNVKALIYPQVTCPMPVSKIKANSEIFQSLKLADPHFDKPSHIDLLLSAEMASKIMIGTVIRDPSMEIIAQATQLGWIIYGRAEFERQTKTSPRIHLTADVSDSLRRFWELESLPEKDLLTPEEKHCEEHFKSTHRKIENKYEVQLPFKSTPPDLGESKFQAEKRLISLERKLAADEQLRTEYNAAMADYFKEGHVEIVPDNELDNPSAVYLPHHAVIKVHQPKLCQARHYHEEIQWLQDRGKTRKISQIKSLSPFLDLDGLIHIDSRLQNAPITPNAKNPILLPPKDELTYSIIRQSHSDLFHANPALLINHLRQRYWIPGARKLIRKIVNQCSTCVRVKARTLEQRMADLPEPRVTPSRPFHNTGVDYAGPFLIRSMTPRSTKTSKAYIALFVCFSTRAVHLELVSDLTSEAFIAALHRFVSRRGKPAVIYSDCGTNLVGADKELKRYVKQIHSEDCIADSMSSQGIQWKFNPPATPHFGGLWEAAVKSFKYHYKRVVGETKLTFEEMATLSAQIEAILNSRPLCSISTSPDDFTALTPGHFLTSDALAAVPEPRNRLNRWQLVQSLHQQFWRRWRNEYLTALVNRAKW